MVLPKQIRESLRLGPGDTLDVRTDGDHVVLTPVRERAGLQKKRGIWVYRSGAPSRIPNSDLIDQTRQQRSREIVGTGTTEE